MPLVSIKDLDPAQFSPAMFRQYKACCAAIWCYYNKDQIHYGGHPSPGVYQPPPVLPPSIDCSAFVTYCYKVAGIQDPSGANYAGGNTVSLWNSKTATLVGGENVKARALQPADLCFFGYGNSIKGGNNDHVTIYIDDGYCISMGGEDGPTKIPFNEGYGKSFMGVKRYPFGSIS